MFPFGHVGIPLAIHEALHRHPRFADMPRLPVVWLAVGTMLPDIVDKPLGHGILDWGNGRLWGHTLLFVLVLAAGAWAAVRLRGGLVAAALAALAVGSASHLVLDSMWRHPDVLLWPFFGGFAHAHFEPAEWVHILLTEPFIQATEFIGAVSLAWVAASERRRRRGHASAAPQ